MISASCSKYAKPVRPYAVAKELKALVSEDLDVFLDKFLETKFFALPLATSHGSECQGEARNLSETSVDWLNDKSSR